MTGPTLVVRLVVRDLGQSWQVEGTWDVQGPMGTRGLRTAARWLIEEAEEIERGDERVEEAG